MICARLRKSTVFAVGFLSLTTTLPHLAADTVCLRGRPPFEHVNIIDFRDGRLIFRGVSQEVLRKPLAEVAWFALDDFPPIHEAEQAAASQNWDQACREYLRARRMTHQAWLADLLALRYLRALEAAGRFADAMRIYCEMVSSKGTAFQLAPPRAVAPPGSPENAAALRTLHDAHSSTTSDSIRSRLAGLALELVIHENRPTPPWLDDQETDQPAASPNATTTAPTSQPLGLLPHSSLSDLKLPDNTYLIQALDAALEAPDPTRAEMLLTRSTPHVPPLLQCQWRLFQHRLRLIRGEYALAAAGFLKLATPEPAGKSPTETAGIENCASISNQALYYAALAHEHLNRPDVARGLYTKLLKQKDLPAKLLRRAKIRLQELGE